MAKWGLKRGRRQGVPEAELARRVDGRTLRASFDNTAAKRDLGWSPVSDRAEFEGAHLAPMIRGGTGETKSIPDICRSGDDVERVLLGRGVLVTPDDEVLRERCAEEHVPLHLCFAIRFHQCSLLNRG